MNRIVWARQRHTRGFTLMELVVAIAIIAILTAIAVPSYKSAMQKGNRSDAKNALLDLASREERWFSVNNQYTDSATNLGYASGFPLAVGSGGSSYYSLSVTVTAPTATTAATYSGAATPTGSQTADACYAYQLNQLGQQSNVDGSGNPLSTTGCW